MDRLLAPPLKNREIKDPFSALIEGYSSGGYDSWVERETARALNKSLTNRLGAFHQEVIGALPGWKSTGPHGDAYDVIHEGPFGPRNRPAVAEVKAKYNTMNSNGAERVYNNFLSLRKHSKFKEYDCYLIQMIQKHPVNEPWVPNQKSYGKLDHIRVIGAPEVFAISIGDPNAFSEFMRAFEQYLIEFYNCEPDKKLGDVISQAFPTVNLNPEAN
ncbi:Eco47II family restriction endonuclease [Corynebacterium pseudopelargi]|nr:Eco47II family restriction endonuclease [Corynebacterium pseudopelargi]